MMLRYVILSLMVLLFSGCANILGKEKIVTVKEYKYINLPMSYYQDNIELPAPPSKKRFVNASPKERMRLLHKLNVKLYTTIGKYKLQIKKIKKYEEKLDMIVNEKNELGYLERKEFLNKQGIH